MPAPHPKPQTLSFLVSKGVLEEGIEASQGWVRAGTKAESEKGCVSRAAGALQVVAEWEERQKHILAAWGPRGGSRACRGGGGGRCFSASCSHFSSRTRKPGSHRRNLSAFHFPVDLEGGFCLGLRSQRLISKLTEEWTSPGFCPLDALRAFELLESKRLV